MMPQVTIDITAKIEGDTTRIIAQRDDDIIDSMLKTTEVDTIENVIAWVVYQRLRTITTADIQKRVTFTFHMVDDIVIIDSIDDVQLIPRDQGREDFENLPGWATWTAQEAVDWIEANVTDLASAKTTLQQMARAIVALRNRTID